MERARKSSKKSKRIKSAFRKYFYVFMALLLVGGLIVSATAGLFNFYSGNLFSSAEEEDDYLAALKQLAASLEESLQESPGDTKKKAELASAYFELAMYYSGQGPEGEDKEGYAAKSRALLLEAVEEGLLEPWVTYRIALLALLQKDDAQAEEYLKKTLELDENLSEAHFYYAAFLSARERADEAREHWEKVLELEEEGSYLAQTAEYYLNQQEEEQKKQQEEEQKQN